MTPVVGRIFENKGWLLLVVPLLFLAVFYFYPLLRIIVYSFFPDTSLGRDGIAGLTENSVYLGILWFTIWQAFLSTVITMALALPGAYVFSRYRFRWKKALQSFMMIPFVLPTVVTASAFKALFGKNGLVNGWLMDWFHLETPVVALDQTIYFFLLAHVFYNYSLVLRVVGGFWGRLNPEVTSAAQVLGASPWQVFRKITLPQLMPAVSSAALLVFIFCFTSFGIVLILGGPGFATLEVEIYRQSIQLFNLPMAAALSLIQIVFNFFLMWLNAKISSRSRVSFYGDADIGGTEDIDTPGRKLFAGVNLTFMAVLLATPLLALAMRSIMGPDGVTLAYYKALFTIDSRSLFFVPPVEAVKTSLLYGFSAMIVAVFIGVQVSAYIASKGSRSGSLLDSLVMLPLATSAVTLGFGYIISLNTPPVNFRDSILIVPVAHALVAFPFVVRCVLPGLRQIPGYYREAASMLGASPIRAWFRIDLPLAAGALLTGALFSFLISLGEFGASAFVVRPHTPTIPVAIFRFLGQPGELNFGQAMAMSSILMLVSFSSLWLFSTLSDLRWRRSGCKRGGHRHERG